MLDLDRFKSINDTHGHDCGDAVLIAVVERMQQRLRGCDTLARWGGEEFMVLLPETTLLQATSVAEALRAELHALALPAVGHVTASFGVADYRPAETLDAWLKRLDELVYQAKRAGRDRVVRAGEDRDGGAAASGNLKLALAGKEL